MGVSCRCVPMTISNMCVNLGTWCLCMVHTCVSTHGSVCVLGGYYVSRLWGWAHSTEDGLQLWSHQHSALILPTWACEGHRRQGEAPLCPLAQGDSHTSM